MVILPFSLRCAIVSAPKKIHEEDQSTTSLASHLPLPVMSSYQTCFSSTIWNVLSNPFGDKLTCPVGLRGAEDTQNIFCCCIHGIIKAGISVKNWPMLVEVRVRVASALRRESQMRRLTPSVEVSRLNRASLAGVLVSGTW
jgi:hypothetical protein